MDSQTAALSAQELNTIIDDLKESVFYGVGGFYEKYFESKPWSNAAGEIAAAFKKSQKLECHENGSAHSPCALGRTTHGDLVTWLKTYLKTFPSGLPNTWLASSDQPLHDGDAEEPMPTFYLVQHGRGKQDSWKWSDVQVLVHVISGDSNLSAYQARMRFFLHARYIFNAQPTRLFVPGIYIDSHRQAHMWVFDRQGAYSSTPLVLDRAADEERFLRVMAGYAMMGREELGTNPRIRNDGESNFAVMQDFESHEDERLYFEESPIRKYPGIVYAGPTCYRAGRLQFEDREFVIKFAWRSCDATPEEEITALVTRKKVWGVVQLLGHFDITSIHELRSGLDFEQSRVLDLKEKHSSIDCTAPEMTHTNRRRNPIDLKLYCVAIYPVGRPIQDHKSTQEVLEAFHDIVKALRSLYVEAKILHRDVSPGNIMISTTKQEGAPRGFLIDLDVAICLEKNFPKDGTRYGTRPFMAIGVLLAEKHTTKHDLESLFYSFLWIAICGKGKAWPPQGSKLWGWLQGNFQECAAKKSRDMQAEGFEGVLDEFTQEFGDCKILARELWRIFFLNGDEDENDPEVCYQAVLKAFRNAGAEARSFCSSGTW